MKVFLLTITLVSSVCLGNHGCNLDPSVIKGPDNASILQGWNHTFRCKGTGSYIEWEINGIPVYNVNDSDLKLVNTMDTSASGSCAQQSAITVHAEYSALENTTLSTFAIGCVLKKNFDVAVVSEAYLKVHVIGEVGAMELISPTSSTSCAMIQWKAPDVLFESSSPLYYNITVRRNSSGGVIAQTTTTNTFFPIDSDLLASCDFYQLTMLPFQQISSKTELGIMTQEVFFPPPLPPTNVNLSVSIQSNSAKATIYFQVQSTNCSFQWPSKFIVTVMQQGTITNESLQSAEQTVVGTMNNYTLEELNLRKKYQVSIKLERSRSSSAPKLANFSTFNLQNLMLTVERNMRELNIHCDMAKGAEDKNCTIEMRNETGVLQQNCFQTIGRDATCKLDELTLGKYWIQAYDQEWKETPAVERAFFFTEELYEDLISTAPTTRIDDATTNLASSPSRLEDEETMQNYLIVGTVTPITVVIITAATCSLVTLLAIVIIKFHRKRQGTKSHLSDTEAAAQTAEKNKYEEHKTSKQQENLTESTAYADVQTAVMENFLPWEQHAVAESTVEQQSTYADSHTIINTTATSNKSSNQYQKQRKEQLVHSCLEKTPVLHSPSPVHTPDCTSL